uniref:Gag-pol polyprotein n=1 Tax=Solanum tuberosum TaxID=4113 RepID=M1DZB8_SOLTU
MSNIFDSYDSKFEAQLNYFQSPWVVSRGVVSKVVRPREFSEKDPGSTMYYVTPFIVRKLCIVAQSLDRPFVISTPVDESIIARRVYRGCMVEIIDRQTSVDLVELEMVDFDVIMGIHWLASCYANVDCRTKIVRFHFPKEATREWKSDTTILKVSRGVVSKVVRPREFSEKAIIVDRWLLELI